MIKTVMSLDQHPFDHLISYLISTIKQWLRHELVLSVRQERLAAPSPKLYWKMAHLYAHLLYLEYIISNIQQEVIALTRPSSLDKPENKTYQSQGVTLRPFNLSGTHEELLSGLTSIDVLIAAFKPMPETQLQQIPLAKAAKQAGVKRFLPCAWRTVLPPTGLHTLRSIDEQIMNEIKLIKLPYTYIDVGSWYQLSVPSLPSGKTSYLSLGMGNLIPGDGNTPTALTDLWDIGRYVAKIIADDRTLNKYVFIYNELWTTNQIYSHLESTSGEKIPERIYQSEEQLRAQIASVPDDSTDFMTLAGKVVAQYAISWGIRGDNTPEYAKYLGYVTSKELYPDFQFMSFEEFVEGAVEGKAHVVYREMKAQFAAAAAAAQQGK